jgi:opacity protein-like surface antigen
MKILLFLSLTILLIPNLSYSQKAYGSELSATVAIPTGPSSEYFNTGYGAIGGFYYDMESNWRIGLTLGFIRFGANSTELNNYFQTRLPAGTEGTIEIDGSVSTITILLSCKYVIPSGASTKFYGIIEGGLYTYWTKTKGKVVYTSPDAGEVPFDKSEFSSEIGWDLGFGALFSVSEDVSIDASVRYYFVRNEGTIKVNYDNQGNYRDESVGSSHFLNIGVGANWNFNL